MIEECVSIEGIDRNPYNVTIGNCQKVRQYDLSKALQIVENSHSIMRSLKRNDVRIRKKLYSKYGQRRKNRTDQLLHHVSKHIARKAKEKRSVIVFENIIHIRRLYQRGNYQSRAYRSRMNSWSFRDQAPDRIQGSMGRRVPIIQPSVSETRGTSQLCPRCGKKITQVDWLTRQQLWCDQCKKWTDRDIVAAMNLSIKGLSRFASSKGLAGEAMKGNVEKEPLILRIDASKLSLQHGAWQNPSSYN
jgi:IS605 OrfB family transposase